MKTESTGHLDRAIEEVASQRELFRQTQRHKLKRLPQEWRDAVERGEELLRHAQKRKIESDPSFPLLWKGTEREEEEAKQDEFQQKQSKKGGSKR